MLARVRKPRGHGCVRAHGQTSSRLARSTGTGAARSAYAVVADAAGVLEAVEVFEGGLRVLAARPEVIAKPRQGDRAIAVNDGQCARDQLVPGLRREIDAIRDLG